MKLRYNSKVVTGLVLIAIFMLLFLFNHFNGQIVDDLGYSYESHPLQKVIWEYFNWNGRSFGEFFAIGILLKLKPVVVDLLNTLAFMGLTLGLERLTNSSVQRKFNIWSYAFLVAMALSFVVVPGQDFFWTTGSANYLYTNLFAVGALVILFKDFRGELFLNKKWVTVAMVPLGVLAGWSTENMGGTIVLAALLIILLVWMNRRQVNLNTFVLAVSALVGYLLLVLAPGNAMRAQGLTLELTGNISHLFDFASQNYFALVLMYFVGLVISIVKAVKKQTFTFKNYSIVEPLLLGVLAFANYFALALSPLEPAPRAHVGFVLLLSVGVVNILNRLLSDNEWRIFPVVALSFIALQFVVQVVPGMIATRINGRDLQARYDYVIQQKNEGNDYPLVSAVNTNEMSKFYGGYQLQDVTSGASARYTKNGYRDFFGVKNVFSVSPEVANAFYASSDPELVNIQQQPVYARTLHKKKYGFVQFGLHKGQPSIKIDNLKGVHISHFDGASVVVVGKNRITIFGTMIKITSGSATRQFRVDSTNYLVLDKNSTVVRDLVSFTKGNASRGK